LFFLGFRHSPRGGARHILRQASEHMVDEIAESRCGSLTRRERGQRARLGHVTISTAARPTFAKRFRRSAVFAML